MIIILLADGFEELEALSPLDILKRAGHDVKTVGITGKEVTGTHGVKMMCDLTPSEVNLSEVELAIFPGGLPGAFNLDNAPFTDAVINAMTEKGGRLAAICAAPFIFGKRGLLEGKCATCYPGFESELRGAKTISVPVVTDGNITTARSFDAAFEFGRELERVLKADREADDCTEERLVFDADEEKDDEMSVEDDLVFEPSDDIASGLMFKKLFESIRNAPDEEKSEKTEEEEEEADDGAPDYSNYKLPSIDCLSEPTLPDEEKANEEIKKKANTIIETLANFNVKASIKGIDRGPRITRYEIVPDKNVKVNAVTKLFDDIALNLGAGGMRMEAPIPGKSAIGFEVPNDNYTPVALRELIATNEFKSSESNTIIAIGKDVSGNAVYADVAKLPHALIAGAVGMGKTVFVNGLIASLLYKARPDDVRLILIDTKAIEFNVFNDLPHLLLPVITDAKRAAAALMWAVDEVERRFDLIEAAGVRNIDKYNEAQKENGGGKKLERIVIIIDELEDLMMQHRDYVEDCIMRIAQKARAAGIHLVISTHRPGVNVITGCIKANIPSRIAFKVTCNTDSRIVLEMSGAEHLLSKGDMLYKSSGSPRPIRVQSCFVSDEEIKAIVESVKIQVDGPNYSKKLERELDKIIDTRMKKKIDAFFDKEEEEEEEYSLLRDQQFLDAVDLAIRSGKVSTSLLQRKLSIGYGKAAKFIDAMEEIGIASEQDGMKPRTVLITIDEWHEKLARLDF